MGAVSFSRQDGSVDGGTREDLSDGPSVVAGAALSDAGRERVRAEWARRLAAPPGVFAGAGSHVVAREDSTAVVAVELFGTCVVTCPPAAAARLEGLHPAALTDVDALVRRLHPLRLRPIGTAALSYRDTGLAARATGTAAPSPAGDLAAAGDLEVAGDVAVDQLRRSLPADEWDESGLAAMPLRWAAFTSSGEVAALAGYERWGEDVAQVGVAAAPAHRGLGHASAVARRVVTAALDEGLVVQWRCRLGNEASERLCAAMGFVRVGRQTAVLVGDD